MNKSFLNHDLELLSSYLDDQLSPSEKKQVEERLESDPEFIDALEKLRRTHLILRSLPRRAAPRNFTLSAEMDKKKVGNPLIFQVFRFSSAVAVLGLVILLYFDFMPFLKQPLASQNAEVKQAPAAAAPVEKSIEPPVIITWGNPQPEILGKGGGGGGDNAPAGMMPSEVIPVPDSRSSQLLDETAIPPALPLSPQMESPLVSSPETTLTAPQIEEEKSKIGGTGPILGIPPSNERGSILSTLSIQSPKPINGSGSDHRILELILGAFAFLSGTIAFLIHKKRSF